MREREMTRSMRNRGRTLRGIALFSLLLIPALLVGCKNKGSDGPKGPATGAAITGTAQNGFLRLSVNINPNRVAPGGSAGITVLATTINGAPLEGQNVQMATSGGTLESVAGKTDAAGKFVTSISIPETFGGSSVIVSAIVQGLTASATLNINVPGTLSIDPAGPLTLAPGDRQFLNCVGGVDPVRWEPSGGTLNRLDERSVIFTAGSLTGTFFVKCTDAANNSASVQITISTEQTKLTITPASATLRPGQTQTFQASGGRPGYTWSITSSTGTLNTTTGPTVIVTAGSISGTLTVTDSVGATAQAKITIEIPALTLTPSSVSVTVQATGTAPGTCSVSFTRTFVVTGGAPPYTFTTALGPPTATITPAGPTTSTTLTYTFSATMTGGDKIDDVVTVTDSAGSTPKSATVTVTCTAST